MPTSKQRVEGQVGASGVEQPTDMISHPVPTVTNSCHRHDTDLALLSPQIYQICV